MDTGHPVYVSPRRLASTSFLYTGPPGGGKTTLMENDFSILVHDPDAVPVVIDFKPKAPLFHWCRDYCFATGLADRVRLLDLSNPTMGFDPLLPDAGRPNLHPALAAKQVREGIRSSYGMRDLSETRQLSRFLFYGLLSSRFLGKGLPTALDVMWPKSPLRKALIEKLPPEFARLKAGLQYIESLSVGQRDSLIASTLAMLDTYVTDPTIYHLLNLEPRLNLHHVFEKKEILLINPGTYTYLSLDDVKLFGRFLVNRIMSTRFSRPDIRSRVFLFMDECHLGISHDLALSLDLGRELGLTCFLAHQRLTQFEQEDPSGTILDAVMTDCQVKQIFGNLSVRDLEILEKETRLREFDPYKIKHVTWQLESRAVEVTRATRSFTHSREQGQSISYPEMVTDTEGGGESHGTQEDETLSHQHSDSRAASLARARGRTTADGVSRALGRTWADGYGRSHGEHHSTGEGFGESDLWNESFIDSAGWVEATAQQSGLSTGEGTNEVTLPDGTIIPSVSMHDGVTQATSLSSGQSGSRTRAAGAGGASTRTFMEHSGTSDIESFSHLEGRSEVEAVSHVEGTSDVHTTALTLGTTDGSSVARRRGSSDSTSKNWSRGVQRGKVPGESTSEGVSKSVSIGPWHELHYRYVPGNVQFFTREEQALENIQEMKAKSVGQYFLAAPNSGQFVQAPMAFEPQLTKAWLARCLARVEERQRALPAPQEHEAVPLSVPQEPEKPSAQVKVVTPELVSSDGPSTPTPPPTTADDTHDEDEADEYDLFR